MAQWEGSCPNLAGLVGSRPGWRCWPAQVKSRFLMASCVPQRVRKPRAQLASIVDNGSWHSIYCAVTRTMEHVSNSSFHHNIHYWGFFRTFRLSLNPNLLHSTSLPLKFFSSSAISHHCLSRCSPIQSLLCSFSYRASSRPHPDRLPLRRRKRSMPMPQWHFFRQLHHLWHGSSLGQRCVHGHGRL